ncbi:hypothetical protein E2562_005233 [Oryza meyeriana var. granulata]|uniref:Uncharacterized protein n=1 Tax=Oryza meyeriana var. granulata TaxID=110450 RepID=A0A6G1EET8_9ORYZ|nr:hypothetical protein E2562_005233 [Oryza meyeriana var. granulata]
MDKVGDACALHQLLGSSFCLTVGVRHRSCRAALARLHRVVTAMAFCNFSQLFERAPVEDGYV